MIANFQELKDFFEFLSTVLIILGVPAGLYQYFRTVKREQRDREYGTYNALDEKYLEFLTLCFEHPDLDTFDIADKKPTRLTQQKQKQEMVAFTILFSIFERAFLMYKDQDTEVKREQWSGWQDYIGEYCRRQNFRKAWTISGKTFDTRYQEYMAGRLSEFTVDSSR